MKRVILSATMLGVLTLISTGCDDQTKVEKKETISTPTGTTTTTTVDKVESTGSNPPANATGETGKTATPK